MSCELSVNRFGILWITVDFYQNIEFEWINLHKHEVGKMVDNNASKDYYMKVKSFKLLKSGNYKINALFNGATLCSPYCSIFSPENDIEYAMLLNPQGEILKIKKTKTKTKTFKLHNIFLYSFFN